MNYFIKIYAVSLCLCFLFAILPFILEAQCNCTDKFIINDISPEEKESQKLAMTECLKAEKGGDELALLVTAGLGRPFPQAKKLRPQTVLEDIVKNQCEKIHGDKAFTDSLLRRVKKEYDTKKQSNFTILKYGLVCASVKKRLKVVDESATSIISGTVPKTAITPPDTTIKRADWDRIEKELKELRNKPDYKIWLILSLLGLGIGLVSFLIYYLNKPIPIPQIINTGPADFKDFEQRFQHELSNLYIPVSVHQQKMEQLKEQYRKLPDTGNTYKESEKEYKPYQPKPVPIPKIKLYAATPAGKTLTRVSEYISPLESYFTIEYESGAETGTLRLVDDPTNRAHAFSMTDNLKDACELRGSGRPNAGQRVQETPGKVEFQNGYWTIIKPIILDW